MLLTVFALSDAQTEGGSDTFIKASCIDIGFTALAFVRLTLRLIRVMGRMLNCSTGLR